MASHGKAQRTRERLVRAALDLCAAEGFENVSVGRIAEAAGVTEMTFYRNFPTKESVLLDDPFDPVIADAVVGQPAHLPALAAVAAGVRSAWGAVETADLDVVRDRLGVVAQSPRLRGAMTQSTAATAASIGGALRARGAAAPDAEIAAAAAVAALTAALMAWAQDDSTALDTAIERALRILEGER
ncbi:TetR family transcriptional regulator [Gordonia sp. SID5947]|uniref:TetR/AcrR family transcriptional regulator n=1 Tax=Gordonia sp. SID5947 TaxID=2690315 RepID=UPI00136D295E|nr:helix-turn-helix domain-containing protein [Gordonia sp. SID5947]MYR06656.1 TetR family transcriptional regulator [Gordonia sp. SID5947]